MMARVEGMPLPALEQGVDWKWETFGEFLDRFEGAIAVNAGFLVGHCAIRRYVMGTDAVGGEATPEQIAEMRAELGRSLDAGRARLLVHAVVVAQRRRRPAGGQPLGHARGAHRDERGDRASTRAPRSRASCRAASTSSPTTRSSCSAQVSAAANRPLNWNVLTVDAREPERVPRQLSAGDRAAELGGRLVALTMPVQVPMNMSFLNFCGIWLIPGWSDVLERAGARAHRAPARPRDAG